MFRRIMTAALATLVSGSLFVAGSFMVMNFITEKESFRTEFKQDVVIRPEISGGIDTQYISETDGNLLRRVDFDVLVRDHKNPDIAAWVYIPETEPIPIDLPVMQEPAGQPDGEYYYLWRNADRVEDKSSGGSIFMPYVPLDEDEDPGMVQVMFGHRMRNRELAFSSLKYFLEQEYLDAHPYVYVYYPDRAERYAVWAGCNAHYLDEIYRSYPVYEKGSAGYRLLLEHVANDLAKSASDIPVTEDDRMLVLSTCYQDDTRMLVACILDKTYYYENDFDSEDGREDEAQ